MREDGEADVEGSVPVLIHLARPMFHIKGRRGKSRKGWPNQIWATERTQGSACPTTPARKENNLSTQEREMGREIQWRERRIHLPWLNYHSLLIRMD